MLFITSHDTDCVNININGPHVMFLYLMFSWFVIALLITTHVN